MPVIQEDENEGAEEPIPEPLTIDQMIGEYDDAEFMVSLRQKGQVFMKQEYHRIMPFCMAGDATSLDILLTFLSDAKRLGHGPRK